MEAAAKRYETVYNFKKLRLKTRNRDQRKTIKVMKVFRVKRVTFTGKAWETVIVLSIRYLLVRHGDHH